MDGSLSVEGFINCIREIVKISDSLIDGWILQEKENAENGIFLTKKHTISLNYPDKENIKFLVTFEYHVVYNISYGVPMLCFKAWKQDGSLLSMEEYWTLNDNLKESNMYDTLTQLDHPVLCQPFLCLHPCKTQEVIQPFLQHSKNPVISWMSVVGPFVHLTLPNQYLNHC